MSLFRRLFSCTPNRPHIEIVKFHDKYAVRRTERPGADPQYLTLDTEIVNRCWIDRDSRFFHHCLGTLDDATKQYLVLTDFGDTVRSSSFESQR